MMVKISRYKRERFTCWIEDILKLYHGAFFCYNMEAMENFKFILLSIIVLSTIGLVGYWAVRTIEPGDLHVSRQKQIELETKNQELEKKVTELKNELASLQPPAPELPTNPEPTNNPPTTTPTSSKYQSLINDLQKMIDKKLTLKVKSTGASVGTVQTFLNIYNNTSRKVDNDFGSGTKTDITNFQTAVGITADGEAGPGTFQKMIEWLRGQ
jgi:cell division protein FtsB